MNCDDALFILLLQSSRVAAFVVRERGGAPVLLGAETLDESDDFESTAHVRKFAVSSRRLLEGTGAKRVSVALPDAWIRRFVAPLSCGERSGRLERIAVLQQAVLRGTSLPRNDLLFAAALPESGTDWLVIACREAPVLALVAALAELGLAVVSATSAAAVVGLASARASDETGTVLALAARATCHRANDLELLPSEWTAHGKQRRRRLAGVSTAAVCLCALFAAALPQGRDEVASEAALVPAHDLGPLLESIWQCVPPGIELHELCYADAGDAPGLAAPELRISGVFDPAQGGERERLGLFRSSLYRRAGIVVERQQENSGAHTGFTWFARLENPR